MTRNKLPGELRLDYLRAAIHASNRDEIGLTPRQKIIARVLTRLCTDVQRRCFCAYYGQEMGVQEIANAMHVNQSSVSRNISSARRKINTVLDLVSDREETK